MCANPRQSTAATEQPFRKGQVIYNSRSVVYWSWSILTGGGSVITRRRLILNGDWSAIIRDWRDLIRNRNTVIRGCNTAARGGSAIIIRSHLFVSSGVSPPASPGVAPSTSAGFAPYVPHHETAATRPNPSAGETFNSKHAKRASGADPHR